MKSQTKKFFSFLFLCLFSLSLCQQKLTRLGNGKFKVTGTENIIDYPCRYGGEAVAVWATLDGEEVDSSQPVKPIFVEEGYEASDLVVKGPVKTDIKDIGTLHIAQQNPATGNLHFWLRKNEPFYITTILMTTSRSDNPHRLVANYFISVDTNHYSRIVPQKELSGIIRSGVLMYVDTEYLHLEYHTWDQKTDWSNFHSTNTQDIYYKLSPDMESPGYYEGNGFWVCVDNNPESKSRNDIQEIGKLRRQGTYQDFKKSTNSKEETETIFLN